MLLVYKVRDDSSYRICIDDRRISDIAFFIDKSSSNGPTGDDNHGT